MTQEKRKLFTERIKQIDSEKLVFLDETGIHLAMARNYGRTYSAKRVYEAKRQRPKQSEKYTWISALSKQHVFAHLEIYGSMTGDAFLYYVSEILLPELEPEQVVIMDNLSCHRTDAVQKAFEKAGIELLYLPPYSPDFNPIEECWSKFKAVLRKIAARTIESMQEATQKALESISKQDIAGWFRHFERNIHCFQQLL